MRADRCKMTADSASRLLAALATVYMISLPLAAQSVKPDAPAERQQRLDVSELKRIKFVAARYPELALRHGMDCIVELSFTVLPDGSTADIEVTYSDPIPLFALFEVNAIQAVKQWRYEPLIRNGQPVAQKVETRIRFKP